MERIAPINGLNLDAPITELKAGDALRCDDWVCRSEGLTTRDGYSVVRDETGETFESMLSYPGQLFGATDDAIYPVSGAARTGMLSGDWAHEVIANPGGQHLVAVNGADALQHYNGVTWDEPTISGIGSTELFAVTKYVRRLFFAEKNSLNLYYLPLNAFSGTVSVIPLHAQFTLGGSIVAVGSDNANLYIATEKQIAIYQGTNPDRDETFARIGVYRIPEPVGKHSISNGAILTVDGLLSIADVAQSADSTKAFGSISRKADKQIAGATQVVDSLDARFLMLGGGTQQWVKSDTGGWTRFTGFPSATFWIEHDDGLYFATSDGKMCKYGGVLDDDAPIRAFSVSDFARYGTTAKKQFKRIRSFYTAAHPYVPKMQLLIDYENLPDDFEAVNIDDTFWFWSDVTWPRQPMPWYREISAKVQPWRTVTGRGVTAAVMKSVQTKTPIIWTGYEMTFKRGKQH